MRVWQLSREGAGALAFIEISRKDEQMSKLMDLINQLSAEAKTVEQEPPVEGQGAEPQEGGSPEDANGSGDEAQESPDYASMLTDYKNLIDEQQEHIDKLVAQISVLVKQGAPITDETDAKVKEALESGANKDLEERAKALEEQRKGIYSLNLGKED